MIMTRLSSTQVKKELRFLLKNFLTKSLLLHSGMIVFYFQGNCCKKDLYTRLTKRF